MELDLPCCAICGAQYEATHDSCPICEDERQYVNWAGQQWTTLRELHTKGHRGTLKEEGPGVIGVGLTPSVAIGQRALLLRTATGNVLFDCLPYLDDDLVGQVEELGGIDAITVSHPHFYGAMVEWGHAFDAPVYVHAADREWVARPDDTVVFWDGDTRDMGPGLTLINAGLHFAGGTVLHWRDDPDGGGALLSGDIIQVAMDRRWVSFMYSFPNHIPERPGAIRRAVALLDPYAFARVYGSFWGRVVTADGHAALRRSAERYRDFALDDS